MRMLKKTEFEVARSAYLIDSLAILSWTAAKEWSKERGWSTPWFGWKRHFLKQVLKTEENFIQAVDSGSIVFWVLVQE